MKLEISLQMTVSNFIANGDDDEGKRLKALTKSEYWSHQGFAFVTAFPID
jgi:hypothetical protein